MQEWVTRTSASVGSTMPASGTASTRTSPALYITVARMGPSLKQATAPRDDFSGSRDWAGRSGRNARKYADAVDTRSELRDAEGEQERGDEHQVTPVELFFDLVFVFAITQVTRQLANEPTWGGVLRGMLVLAALWWAWNVYAWLTSATDVDEGGVRLAMLVSMGAMLVVALAVPGAFGGDAVLFAVAYLFVRLIHLVLSAGVGRDDPDRLGALLRCLAARAGRISRWERAYRGVGSRACDRLPRPGRDRRRARLADRARALRGAARADDPDRARRVDHCHRCGRRVRGGNGSDRRGGARNRGRLGALVALLRRSGDLRAEAAHAGERRRAGAARTGLLRLPPPADGRRHRPLRSRPQDDAATSVRRSTRCPPWDSAAVRPSTCSGTSPSSSERPAGSSGGVRSERSCCSPSSRLQSRSRRSRRSAS